MILLMPISGQTQFANELIMNMQCAFIVNKE